MFKDDSRTSTIKTTTCVASPLILNPETNTQRSRESKKKRKKKPSNPSQNQNQTRRKSPAEQQSYSSKLIKALRQVRRNPSPSLAPASSSSSSSSTSDSPCPVESIPHKSRALREAADRVLAVAAKGRTRWSRAILTNRLKLKFKKKRKQRVAIPNNCRSKRRGGISILALKKDKRLPTVQRKVRVLGSLVPGCRKLPFPDLLEEATDYIAALEMQVRAMTTLTQLLSVAGGAAPTADPSSLDCLSSTQR
ncbi:transcription factor bHLH148-like [Telopea speciosissima]|uniref:transcription factor bHLH148-like n=1 Tax=Telopea speciosissima TaxID=54955 RepID=UPI001CC6E86E|nr:transcription factor bHLH148-like [Telopea speciosissima]